MTDTLQTCLRTKMLVLDDGQTYSGSLKHFCRDNELICIRPQKAGADNVMAILRSNVDLGGIMLFEHYDGRKAGLELARQIHTARPELPIFLRREQTPSLAGLSERDALRFCCGYTLNDLHILSDALASSIFSRIYPNPLVRGITEMSRDALALLFPRCEVTVQAPFLAVKDRLVYGEMFTLIAIESSWCRGYMMLQAEESPLMALLEPEGDADPDFRQLNAALGEATNLIWGSFKNRYAGNGAQHPALLTQVPIIVNHQRRYISFGSEDPQLCIKYQLRDRDAADGYEVTLVQRFVFNLCWSPDEFQETPSVESLVESGELELF
ncbi:chemotaxis protein CheX [Chromobacterium sinusclupearum]|uniref:Chemotaxis protein CheX n=1 Tax=Chromobacterium sinusclupearum TaxID=2077146 RepID=A0A2K4MQW5_9NEIS|nr:chemotaxis protein CheX [Chromobacterium sinusclupearum]POA99453.1 chemotaxis protein CheX [Chromobacterium sinusclupearum]